MRREPRWLTAEAVLAIHAALLATFGGRGGLRDRGLLESALAAPRHRYAYGERDIIVLAGQYAHALARNHAFVDGNKRIALLVLYVFLRLNGLRFAASEADAARVMQELAAGELSAEALCAWLKSVCRRTAARKHGRSGSGKAARRRKPRSSVPTRKQNRRGRRA